MTDHPTTIRTCSTDASSSSESKTSRPTASTSSTEHDSTSDTTTTKTHSPTSLRNAGSSAEPTAPAHAASAPTPAHAYPKDSSTGNANNETPATHPTPATAKYPSTINWHTLTPSAHWTITHIATPISNGYDITEIAHTIGRTRTWINAQLEQLREELVAEEPNR
jgi:hypothetical protein